MLPRLRQTKWQVARGVRPDVADREYLALVKNVSRLRLTYQVAMVIEMAKRRGLRVRLLLPANAVIDDALRAHIKSCGAKVSVERTMAAVPARA